MSITALATCLLLNAGLGQGAEGDASKGDAADAETSAVENGISRIVEAMKEAPALSPEERLALAASVASGVIKPLSVPVAIFVTLVGFALLLFGQRLVRAGIIIYLMAFCGFAGLEIGARFGDSWQSLAGGGIGCVVGAAIALPLRALARSIVGGLAGGVLAAMVMQMFTSSWSVTLGAALVGIVVSGLLAIRFPRPLMIVGYAMFGAAAASVGILSVSTEPVDGHITYGAAHISGMLLAAGLGVLFQSQLGLKKEEG